MHEQNIETLRDEALRLIDLQLTILREMLNAPGVIAESATGEIQTFDRNKTLKYIEILEGEKTKLDRLELVLAVVGTMKAGKSTTINAIVGTEVLPNRNRPMTALPTLIKHTPGQVEPVLKFENSAPIEKLMRELSQLVKHPDNNELVEHLAKNEHMEDLLKLIDTQLSLEKTYKGAQSIFQFLETLNDLVRLSRELDVEFPFSDYDEIHELPVIEIEFVHLREQNDSTGTLTLLDTPGPNESGQPHLREMLKEQLRKASAVLAVLDFTQLKSDADAQVRDNLKEIASIAKGRLYALVNKFDQQDRNSDSEEETKLFVANSLMEGKITETLIFPVSSKFAYLANYARRELAVYGTLPDHSQHPWVKDFGTEAFGRFWKDSIANLEGVKKGVDLLWDDSLFHAPLEKIIHAAHAQAALLAVDSASAKLVETSKELNNFFNLREKGLAEDSEKLKIHINKLQLEINKIKTIEDEAKKQANQMLEELEAETKKSFEKLKINVMYSIDYYFKKGKDEEAGEYKDRLEKLRKEEEKRAASRSFFNAFVASFLPQEKSKATAKQDFDPSSPILKFTESEKARKLIDSINNKLDEIVRENELAMKKIMDQLLSQFQNNFSKTTIANAAEVVNTIKNRINQDGFSINISVPNASLLSLKASGSELLADLVDEKTKPVTRHRRKDNLWGKICRWFETDDWGWEEYQAQEKYFEVNIEKIKKSVQKDVERIFYGLDKDISEKIKIPLRNGINDFFHSLRKTVEQIRGDLQQSIRDQEGSKAEQEALANCLAGLKKDVPDIFKYSDELHKETTLKCKVNSESLA